MQVQHEQSQNELIESLQRQVNELTAEKLLIQEQLARKEQFTAIIAHELRSPLTPIINYAQIVARPHQRRERPDPERPAERIHPAARDKHAADSHPDQGLGNRKQLEHREIQRVRQPLLAVRK